MKGVREKHLSDAVIIRISDKILPQDRLAEAKLHLDECQQCASRLQHAILLIHPIFNELADYYEMREYQNTSGESLRNLNTRNRVIRHMEEQGGCRLCNAYLRNLRDAVRQTHADLN